MNANSALIPKTIDEKEILVRFLFTSHFKNSIIQEIKIKEGDVFLDTRSQGVSLQRNSFCNEKECKTRAKEIPSKTYVGFAIFKYQDFTVVNQNYKEVRLQFQSEIRSTPTDSNPSHADLIYINPAPKDNETPNTAIRYFSRKLCGISRIVIDEFPDDHDFRTTLSDLFPS